MSSVSSLGDLGYQIAAVTASTSTGSFINIVGTASGTSIATGRILDLVNVFKTATGGKLDATVNPLPAAAKQFRSVAIAIPAELVFKTSGLSLHVVVSHQDRTSTSGAGSTWVVRKTETKRFKNGTSTALTTFQGFVSSLNAQAIGRYYKAKVTVKKFKASSTAAVTTASGVSVMINGPQYLLGGAAAYPAQE